jgi:mannose-6-phosphate isomerase
LGKTEAWYIVDAVPGSKIYAGLKSGVDRKSLRQAIAGGATEEVLHVIEPQPGQCIFIPAGTVHALGGGLVVAEIQQSSDTTFRLFDWNRVGDDGRPRPLHIEQALEVTDFSIGPIFPQMPQADEDGLQTLVRCDKFVLKQVACDENSPAKRITMGNQNSPVIVTVVKGAATIACDDRWSCKAMVGQAFLVPAATAAIEISGTGNSVLLLAYLP